MLGIAAIATIPGLILAAVDVAGDITYFRAEQQHRLHAIADRAAIRLDREIGRLINPMAIVAVLSDGAAETGADGFQARTDVIARRGPDCAGAAVVLPVVRDGASVPNVQLCESRVRELLDGLLMGPAMAVDVMDWRGIPVAHAGAAGQPGLPFGPLEPTAPPRQGGLLRPAAADGSYRVTAIARLTRAPGWQVVASEASSAADGNWVRPLVLQSGVFAASILIAFIATWRLSGRLTRPLALLGERARAVASGGGAGIPVPPSGVLEFETLRASLRHAELALERRAATAQSAMHEARTSSELLASVVNGTADQIFVTGPDGRYLLANRAALSAYGARDNELLVLGKSALELLPPGLGQVIEAADREVLRSGARAMREISWTRHGGEPRIYAVSKAPWRNAAGDIIGVVSVTRDVTEQRAAEARLRAAQANLLRATHLSAMGAMASGLAHEINQPLAATANYLAAAARLLVRRGSGDGAAAHAVHDASQQVRRAGEIVRRLRDFVSRGEVELQEVELGELLSATAVLVRASGILGGVSLTASPPASPLHVLADRVQMQQVLFNLIRNAAEAIASQDPPPASPGCIVMGAGQAAGGAGGGMAGAELTVADNGPGLAPEVRTRLFTPFVSTKPDGMGIGLAICHSIVEGHGGVLTVETRPGATMFRIILPSAGGSEQTDAQPDDKYRLATGQDACNGARGPPC